MFKTNFNIFFSQHLSQIPFTHPYTFILPSELTLFLEHSCQLWGKSFEIIFSQKIQHWPKNKWWKNGAWVQTLESLFYLPLSFIDPFLLRATDVQNIKVGSKAYSFDDYELKTVLGIITTFVK